MLPEVQMWDAGLDYIRLTSKDRGQGDETARIYKQAARSIVAATQEGEADWEEWRWRGYYGKRCRSVSYGSGFQGHILQVSGWQANEPGWQMVPFDNVPRLDIQLTLWFDTDTPDIAKEYARRSAAYSALRSVGGWKVTYIGGFGNGDTAYIGSRSSDSSIRIYDKYRERGEDEDYKWAWRFEVEAKDSVAASLWPEAGAPTPSSAYWADIVKTRLAGRGVVLPRLRDVLRVPPARIAKEASSCERTLAWLRSQVSPALDRLRAEGYTVVALARELGLSGAEWGE